MRKAKTVKEFNQDMAYVKGMASLSNNPNCSCQATPEPVKAIRPGHMQQVGAIYPKTRKMAIDALTAHGIMIGPKQAAALHGQPQPEPRENDAITTYYKFLKFVMVEQKPKTKVYEVYNTRYGALLGVVKWYGPWRRYCFWPQANCIFSAGCMEDVAQFINNRTD